MLETTSKLTGDASGSMKLDDWNILVADWAFHQGERAVKTQSRNQLPLWPSNARDIAKFQHSQLSAVISEPNTTENNSSRCHLPPIPPSVVSVSVQSEKHGGKGAVENLPEVMQTGGMEKLRSDERKDFGINQPSLMKILNS